MHVPLRHAYPWRLAASAAVVALALSGPAFAQTPAPAASVDQTLARKYLTEARNALSDVTELPAAAELAGASRARVQLLITQFNDLITQTSDWRASYEKVEATLASLLASEPQAPAPADAPAAVGTSGTHAALDPSIRAKLVEFGTHLEQFKTAAAGPTPADEPAPQTPPAAMPQAEPPAAAAPAEPPPAAAAAEPPATSVAIDDNPPVEPAATEQDSIDVARDILLHVEAIEVILGAQAAAQKAATAAAGGVVTTTETPSGSTRTTITSPNVTLDGKQLEQVKTHLAEIRRLVENRR
jgi:hypothetical protein